MNQQDQERVFDTLTEYKRKYKGLCVTFYMNQEGCYINSFILDSADLIMNKDSICNNFSNGHYFSIDLKPEDDIWEYEEADEDGIHERDIHGLRLEKENGLKITFEFKKDYWEE